MNVSNMVTFWKPFGIDWKRYQSKPVEEETIKMYTYLIKTMKRDQSDTPLSLNVIYREVNEFLIISNYQMKLFYTELLAPNDTTYMTLYVLTLHVISLNRVSAKTDAIIADTCAKMEKLAAIEQENADMREELSSKDEIIALKQQISEKEAMIQAETRHLEVEQEQLKKKQAFLKGLQSESDILIGQIEENKTRCDEILKLKEKENENFKILAKFESKNWQLQNLNNEIAKLQKIEANAKSDATNALDESSILIVKKLNKDLDTYLASLEEKTSLAEKFFVTEQNKNRVEKVLNSAEFCYSQEDQHNDNNEIQKLNEVQAELMENKEYFSLLRKKKCSLYSKVLDINERLRKVEAIQDENQSNFHAFNEQLSSDWAKFQEFE